MNSDVQVKTRRPVRWSLVAVRTLVVVAVLSALTAFASWGRAIFMNHGDHWGWFGLLMAFFAICVSAGAGLLYDSFHHSWRDGPR